MDNISLQEQELRKQIHDLQTQMIELNLEIYKKRFPDEDFPTPQVSFSDNFHTDAINLYTHSGYPEKYIKELETKINWNSTIALTVFSNLSMSSTAQIIINSMRKRDDTILHELTHISDYYTYCKQHNLFNITYLEFLELKEYICVNLFSEFRAFYRSALSSTEDICQRLEYETIQFSTRQQKAIEQQNLDAFYYQIVSYASYYCAYLEKTHSQEQINTLFTNEKNYIFTLIEFLYPLRNKSFAELEPYYTPFRKFLDQLIIS